MMTFKEQVAKDIDDILDMDVFADEHEITIDGETVTCTCVLQNVMSKSDFGDGVEYSELVEDALQVDCRKSDLLQIPVNGQEIHLDGDLYTVISVADNMGMLCIRLKAVGL